MNKNFNLICAVAALVACLYAAPNYAEENPSVVLPNAKDKPYYYIPDVPEQIGQVDFYLITVGVGDDLAARYGHTGIRVENHVDKTDVVFNWGKFYFDDPMFAVKFYRGDLTYSMGVRTYKKDIEHHRADGRLILQDKINLSAKQKRKLLEKIAWNARPENRDFKYQYWFKNCSTMPRDYLDDILEGQVRAKFYSAGAGKTFRDYVRSNLAQVPMMIPVLDTIMNSKIDREMTLWEEMFLPGKLREQLMSMSAIDEDGNPIAGKPLLSESQTLVNLPENYRNFSFDYGFLFTVLTSVVIALIVLSVVKSKATLFYRLLGITLIAVGSGSGFFGSLMALNWLFSGHPDIWHNANLLLFFPVDFLFIGIGKKLLLTGKKVKDNYPFARAAESLFWLHLAAFATLCIGSLLGIIIQDVWLTVLIPGGFTMLVLTLFKARATEKFSARDAVPGTSQQKAVKQSLRPASASRRRK